MIFVIVRFCYFILILFFSHLLFGQHSQKVNERENGLKAGISGIITDESKNTIPFANVSVYSVHDSALVKGVATDINGNFAITTRPGKYYLKISFLSYQETTLDDIIVKPKQITKVNKITLLEKTTTLNEYEVVAEKSSMELKLDKRVFNVEKDLANTGGSASEVLDNVPSVAVDVEGNVSLRGSEGVRILIDGKPSGMLGSSPADALKLIPANMIDRIELITNPSARYDAEGEVGIINIVLKKQEKNGLNGVFDITAGYPSNYGASYSINYRKKWINLFSSYGINYRKNPGYGYSYQKFNVGDTTYAYERLREHARGGLSNNFKLGSDFYFNDKNTITISGLYNYSHNINEANIVYNDYDGNNLIFLSTERDEDETEIRQNLEGGIEYKKLFKKKEQTWVTNWKYVQSDDGEEADLIQTLSSDASSRLNQRSTNREDQVNMLFQSDYIHPFKEKGKFEIGAKSTWRTIDNFFTVELQDGQGEWNVLKAFDNEMKYTENIYAGYIMLANELNKFSYQLGTRAEYSDIKTELKKTNEVNPRQYLNFFPSTHFSYKLDSTNTMQLSYSRRLTRPRFRHLLPFFGYTDNRNFYSGNPNLNPEYTNSFELSHLKYFEKGSIMSSIYYRYRTGVIQRITLMDTSGYIRTFPINLNDEHAYGLETNIAYQFSKKFRINGSANFYRAINQGSYEGLDYGSDTYAWTGKLTSRLKIFWDIDWQLSFDYRSPMNYIQGRRLAMYSLNTGLSKDVLNKKGTITFSGKDLFNTRKRRTETYGNTFYNESEFQWRTRQFIISFSYRLNQKKQRGSRGDYNGTGNLSD